MVFVLMICALSNNKDDLIIVLLPYFVIAYREKYITLIGLLHNQNKKNKQ